MQIKENFEIKQLTTFKIGGKVKKIYFPETLSEFTSVMSELQEFIVLGSCSNVLFSSEGYDGNIIITTLMKEYSINGSHVKADCGVKGAFLSQKTAEAGLSGFEFMIGFPGSIGGNIFMNAGAHGQTISDGLVSCCLYDCEKKEIVIFTKKDMDFSYRHSVLKGGKYILLSAEFELKKSSCEEIQELMERNLEFRKNIQPSLSIPNAGSVFKNPENDSAGRLLDRAGVRKADFLNENSKAKIWKNHANFIINTGDALSEDVLETMHKMYLAVKNTYTIELKPEIIFIGKKSKKEEELCNILYKTKMQK